MMTETRLAEIEQRAKAATLPPWHHSVTGEHDDLQYSITQTSHITRDVWTIPHVLADVPFIAHSRQDIPDLIAEVKALQEESRRLRRLLGHAINCGRNDGLCPQCKDAAQAMEAKRD